MKLKSELIRGLGLVLLLFGLGLFTALPFLTQLKTDTPRFALAAEAAGISQEQFVVLEQAARPLFEQEFSQVFSFVTAWQSALKHGQALGQERHIVIEDYRLKTLRFWVSKTAQHSFLGLSSANLFLMSIGAMILGAMCLYSPRVTRRKGLHGAAPFRQGLTNRGWVAILLGIWLTLFYVLLYWFAEYLTPCIRLVDGIYYALHPQDLKGASQWFLYGLLYSLAVAVMGLRFALHWRKAGYQLKRTASVVFFQTIFAFLLPEIMTGLHQPYMDLKSAYPLQYDYFYDYKIASFWGQGTAFDIGGKTLHTGTLLFLWGLLLSFVLVPLLTYFFGKRWYCSWVCGCGGLAETAGDPFRHLSDKRLFAWRLERWVIHAVMLFAFGMTAAVLYTYFTGQSQLWLVNSYQLREWYGFFVGAVFAGVVGVGFYPLFGGRIWCRFGCPLAAMMGIVQRFKSRYRITVNGGQCISCGLCSTHCEMGIDVRAYAQKSQDVVRASCVGCGICEAVCPRGVLALENLSTPPKLGA